MPALVELLISLFVDENHKTRTLVLGCFRQISKDLNTASVQVIADAIDPEKDALLTTEEDEDDGVDSEDNEDEDDDRENEKMDSDSEESESDDEGIDTAPDTDLDELKVCYMDMQLFQTMLIRTFWLIRTFRITRTFRLIRTVFIVLISCALVFSFTQLKQ